MVVMHCACKTCGQYPRWTPRHADRPGMWECGCGGFVIAQTTPSLAVILTDHAPDLLAALRLFCREWANSHVSMSVDLLIDTAEAAGLLTEPPRPARLPAMWCGAEAFTQEDNDGR